MVSLIIICIGIVFLWAIIWDVRRIRKTPRLKRPTGKGFLIASFIAIALFKLVAAYTGGKSASDHANARAEYIATLLTKSPELKECGRRFENGEFKTHAAVYLNCDEPFMKQIFIKAGVRHKQSIDDISRLFLEVVTKSDEGESLSAKEKDEEAQQLNNLLIRDESQP